MSSIADQIHVKLAKLVDKQESRLPLYETFLSQGEKLNNVYADKEKFARTVAALRKKKDKGSSDSGKTGKTGKS